VNTTDWIHAALVAAQVIGLVLTAAYALSARRFARRARAHAVAARRHADDANRWELTIDRLNGELARLAPPF
jgi:hypothetical protein